MTTLSIQQGHLNPFDLPPFFKREKKSNQVRIKETHKNVLVMVELPGCIRDDINLSFSHGELTIHANGRFQDQRPTLVNSNQPRTTYSLRRVVKITQQVDQEKISYNYEEGCLRVWLPKVSPKLGPLDYLREKLRSAINRR